MSVADLKARTQQIFDLFNAHDVQSASAYFAEDAELRDVSVARPASGPQQIAAIYARQLDALPDSVVRVDRMVAEGDMVVVEWTLAGTHRGRMLGIPATGKPVSFKGVSLLRYRANMIVTDTRIWDLAGLLRQIGLLPRQE
jgi:steroid delta-isomerase-like uncharacterized protein